jgi:2-keto-4-pentenoate hydratase
VSLPLSDLDNPLIKKGLTAQLAKRRERIAAGEKPLGWKVGFGAPASLAKLGLAAPLTGYLMQRALLLSGSTVSLASWTQPVAEPEICVRMASDLGGGASADAVAAAIKEVLPAIELADLSPPPAPDNLDAVLANDIYQRHAVLCGNTRFGAGLGGLVSRIERRGAEVASTTDPEALTGKLLDIVGHVANVLEAMGERLRAGDVILTGSVTPPVMIEADETEFVHSLDPIGTVAVGFSRD